ncbi:MAG: glutamine synthetase [Flavobacteriales bacterium]|nr:glutamine synthetase [Bacteroidales bacterium AH-315-I05]PCJ79912.1 MAG: glutamine synthetase [Flavobacteriales bacterium]
MSQKEILEYVKTHPAEKVKLAIADIDGVLRGKVMAKDKFLSVVEDGFGFCDVVFGWDMADVCYENSKVTGWHTGYPDADAEIDLGTFRKVPWENDLPFFLADFPSLDICPRNLLKKVKKQAENAGFKPFFSQEFEWFNFKETPWSLWKKDFENIRPLTPGMFGYSILRSSLPFFQKDNEEDSSKTFFNSLFDSLKSFDVPLEGLHTETGPGVYEAAILYSDILEAADRAVLFKTGVKEIAYRYKIVASFMAKWNADLPGCSGHVHQSLWNKNNNLFFDASDEHNMSDVMKHYVAGQLHCLPHILPIYAPTINSYKRLVVGLWAPTTLTWGTDNRTVALRVLNSSSKAARLETRVCGSDTNPYLAMAAALASGLYGIKNKLELQLSTTGNGYEEFKYGVLPKDLNEATQVMKNSEIANELLGQEFVDHFCRTREWEGQQFEKAGNKFDTKTITKWELQRYFEII